MADGYTYKAKINGEWVDINLIESPAELTAKLEKDEEWAKVVRCKDCLWWGEDEEDPSGQRQCTENIGTYWDANSFCSWGERREDGKAD